MNAEAWAVVGLLTGYYAYRAWSTGKKKQKNRMMLEIGRDYLSRCSSIVFDKPAKKLTLTCR